MLRLVTNLIFYLIFDLKDNFAIKTLPDSLLFKNIFWDFGKALLVPQCKELYKCQQQFAVQTSNVTDV